MSGYKICSQFYEGDSAPTVFASQSWDIAIIGERLLDKRSEAACSFASNHSKNQFQMLYDTKNKQFEIDGGRVTVGAIKTRLRGSKNILVEATTLNCPEILYLLRAAKEEAVEKITFLYLEPLSYRRTLKGRLADHRDFDLSDNRRFEGVHGFMVDLNEVPKGQVVFFLGYEKARLGQALEQEEALHKWKKHAVFGIPAFEPAWEIDSIANNVQHLATFDYEVQYAAASSVNAAYNLLNGLLQDDKTDSTIVVAPLGTKPHTIGAALFVVEHNAYDRTALLYDHPQRSKGRTEDIKRWHFYEVSY